MANTITLSQSAYKELLNRITRLEKIIASLSYGSDEWWELSIKKGEEDIKNGNYKLFNSAKEMTKYLRSKI
jgi:hypothetical protein